MPTVIKLATQEVSSSAAVNPYYPRWIKTKEGASLVVPNRDQHAALVGYPVNEDGTPASAAPEPEAAAPSKSPESAEPATPSLPSTVADMERQIAELRAANEALRLKKAAKHAPAAAQPVPEAPAAVWPVEAIADAHVTEGEMDFEECAMYAAVPEGDAAQPDAEPPLAEALVHAGISPNRRR